MKNFLRFIRYLLVCSLFVFVTVIGAFIVINTSLNDKYSLPKTTKIELYDKDDQLYLSFCNNQKQTYVTLDQVSQHVIDAIISIEDKRFFEHRGVDVIRIVGALIKDIQAREIVEGASTITQQYVKMMFLNYEQTINRKLHEALIAINLESRHTKREILEGYLNVLYFDHGVYGVEDASMFYFGKQASELSLVEACTLASIPKGPTLYSPIKNPERNKSRRNLILSELREDGKIDEETYQSAIEQTPNIIGVNQNNLGENAPYFQDMVVSEVNRLNINPKYLEQGIKVYTTLDPSLNQIAIESLEKRLPDSEIEVGMLAVDPNNGRILSIIGGRDYQKSTYNRVLLSKRQPGSSIKPFLYLSALEQGFTVASTFVSEPTTFYIGNTTYSPSNYQNIYANTDISMVYAIATSDNIYAMKTHLFLGPDNLVQVLKRFNFEDTMPSIPSLALGTAEVTLKELTRGYASLASLGVYHDLYSIERVESDGETIYQHKVKEEKVANQSDVYLLNEAMSGVFDPKMILNVRPTGARLASLLSHKYAGKSGSTDTDNWMLGYNKDIVVGVWSGYDDNREIISSEETSFAKYLWRDIVEGYLSDKTTSWYETPDQIVGIELNPVTGFYPSLNEYTKPLYFKQSNIPWYIELLYRDWSFWGE